MFGRKKKYSFTSCLYTVHLKISCMIIIIYVFINSSEIQIIENIINSDTFLLVASSSQNSNKI